MSDINYLSSPPAVDDFNNSFKHLLQKWNLPQWFHPYSPTALCSVRMRCDRM